MVENPAKGRKSASAAEAKAGLQGGAWRRDGETVMPEREDVLAAAS